MASDVAPESSPRHRCRGAQPLPAGVAVRAAGVHSGRRRRRGRREGAGWPGRRCFRWRTARGHLHLREHRWERQRIGRGELHGAYGGSQPGAFGWTSTTERDWGMASRWPT